MDLLRTAVSIYEEKGEEALDNWLNDLSLEDREELSIQVFITMEPIHDTIAQVTQALQEMAHNIVESWKHWKQDNNP